MYQPKTGDRVRVVLEGEATTLNRVGHFGLNWGDGYGNEIRPSSDHVVSIELLTPTEPPVGSVVLDREGDAAQRISDDAEGWRYAVSEQANDYLTWGELTGHYSPVKVIYTPDAE